MSEAVPGWAWAALLGLVGLMASALAWFVMDKLKALGCAITDLRDEFRHEIEKMRDSMAEVRDEVHREVTPIRTSAAQLKALHVGMDRRLNAIEAGKTSKIRAEDKDTLKEWEREE